MKVAEAAHEQPESLTAEQSRAIRTRKVSVALSAGAGCGKTFVLTERFLSYLDPDDPERLEPSKIGQLVAITFTDRAAREMRDRIRQKCYARLRGAKTTAQAEYWAALERALDAARISTIHSFCGALLRAHAVEARLDPGFSVLEQAQADTLLNELIDDVLRRRLAERNETTLELLVQFDLNEIREMLARLVRQRRQREFDPWLERTPEELVARWAEFHKRYGIPAALRRVATSAAAADVLRILREHEPSNLVMQRRRRLLLERLSALAEVSQPRDAAAQLEAIHDCARVQGGGNAKAWASDEAYQKFRDAAKELRECIKKTSLHLEFDAVAALPAAVAALRMLKLAADVAETYGDKKQELGVLDFNDLLSRAHALLTNPAHPQLAGRLSSQIQLLLVDEFQDTDPLQVEIVSALCGEGMTGGKLFFVGDYKQSIYRFRGADPHVFRRLRETIPTQGQLPLTLNFRSQPAILDFVNALFSEELGSGYEPLRPHRPQVSPLPAVEFLWAPAQETNEDKELLRRREADWIARRLRAMIDGQVPLVWDSAADSIRPVRPGDIALLFRALSDVAYYEEALRNHGLDYYLVGGHAFYAQQEIFDLLNLLRAIDSSLDEISLAGVLRSPFFSLSDEALFWLGQHSEGFGGGLAATILPSELDEEQRRRARFARDTLAQLRGQKNRMPIADLINLALAKTGYDAILLGEFLGERKLANLRKLLDQARSFDRSAMFTLSDFITQLAGFVAKQPDEALAATLPEATDVVRLMSIHQAKGLEFPVVVVPDLERSTHGAHARVEFTPELGPMVKMKKEKGEPECLGGYEIHALLEEEEELAERHRLLYVAATRAADYLILSSAVTISGGASGPWMQLVGRHFDLTTGKWLHGSANSERNVPQVKVTSTEPPLPETAMGKRTRKDLAAMVDQALELAAAGRGQIPEFTRTIAADEGARRQYSFSRLSGQLRQRPRMPINADVEDGLPQPISTDPLGLGTLVHAVLAAIDPAQPGDVESVVARLAPLHLADGAQDVDDAVGMVKRFLNSSRVAELIAARESYAELEFLLAWPPDAADSRGIYLGGYIDRLYQDVTGAWHLVDFKTNRVDPGELDSIAGQYEMQMLVYALATERVLKSPPASLTLHFLRTGLEHPFTWDDRDRRRVRTLVDQGIAAAVQSAAVPAAHLSSPPATSFLESDRYKR